MSAQAVWFNGNLVDARIPHLRADDHGLVVGDGVFETLLVVPEPDPLAAGRHVGHGRQAFAVQRHLNRLRRSAAAMGFECPYADDELRTAIDVCLDAASEAGIVRITVTSGRGPLSSWRGRGPGSVLVMAGDQPPHHDPHAAVAVMPFTRNERGAMAGVKTTSYAENVLALRLAVERGASEAVFGDTRGRLSEGTGSNVFWVEGTVLHTPPLDTGCLDGVTRALVMESLDVTEKHLPIDEFYLVNEAFLTSTTRPVQPIGSVDDTKLSVVGGPLTAKAMAAMADLMAVNIDP